MSNFEKNSSDIAIVGMSLRFPGAYSVNEFWENIYNGKETIADVSKLNKNEIEALKKNSTIPFIEANSRIKDVDMFDASFFDIGRREAELMDPQKRQFLECAWEALENAGYDPHSFDGLIGLYAGIYANYYLLKNVYPSLTKEGMVSEIQTMIANEKDHLTTYTAYKLNLKGPVITVQTACSTSLTAVHLGCESLLTYSADMIIAGAATLGLPRLPGYYHHEGGILSSDGHCRTFDNNSTGTVYADGVGVVILKRFNDAVTDRDTIYAVIKGTALNNDGAARVGYTAPGVNGQVEVITRAQMIADVHPETISYIEAHGTGTPLGDSIELEALHEVFKERTEKKGFCAIGSVKPNIGHLGPAAGISGLIKTTLALYHKTIPPQINFEEANDKWNLEDTPFYVNTFPQKWDVNGQLRRAGVSSFGLGGTNVHVVLEEAPTLKYVESNRKYHFILLSAKSEVALKSKIEQFIIFLKEDKEAFLDDLSYTLCTGRHHFKHRFFFVYQNKKQLLNRLEVGSEDVFKGYKQYRSIPVYFLLPKMQKINSSFSIELYKSEPIIKELFNQCMLLIPEATNTDFEKNWQNFLTEPTKKNLTHFIYQYVLTAFWLKIGVKPDFILGEGIGHLVSACISGVFQLKDALSLVNSIDNEQYQSILNIVEIKEPSIALYSPVFKRQLTVNEVIDRNYWKRENSLISNNSVLNKHNYTQQVVLQISDSFYSLETDVNPKEEGPSLNMHCLLRNGKLSIEQLYQCIGRLWYEGVHIDWIAYYECEERRKIALPTYPFQRERYWIEENQQNTLTHDNLQKGDKKAIKEYTLLAKDQLEGYVAPRGEVEEIIAEIWEESLGIKPIGVKDNFFEMGGNSLLGVEINGEICKALNVKIELVEFFENQTIENISVLVKDKELTE